MSEIGVSVPDRLVLHTSTANQKVWARVKGSLPRAGPTILELYDTHTFQIMQTLLDFQIPGYSRLDEIQDAFDRNGFDPNSQNRLILNPSGGTREGHSHGAFSIVKVAECFARLTGTPLEYSERSEPKAGLPQKLTDAVERPYPHDTATARFALIHNQSGAGNSAGIIILEKI